MNKKGNIGIILFFGVLFIILVIGFIASITTGVFDFAGDTITPVMENLGVVGNTNMSEVAGYTFGQGNVFIQALPWIVGFSFVAAIIFSIIFALSMSVNPHPAFIGFYFALMILLIFGTIIISNAYEKIYNQDNELSDRLNEQTLLSYMILFSPMIFTLVTIITGIFVFTRAGEGGGGI